MAELKDGWHRLIARDGTRAGMLVDGGRPVDLVLLDQVDPPKRPSRKFVGTVEQVRERAERDRLERQIRLYEEIARLRVGIGGGGAAWTSAK